MKNIKLLILGILFGIVLSKAEIISWYRIYEMFKFQSFHMYGIIGSAVVISFFLMQLFKKGIIKDEAGNKIKIQEKEKDFKRTFFGGTIFGLGWALSGACAAPLFALLGYSFLPAFIVLIGAILGAFVFGLVSKKLLN
ncbi:YeeE/YedE thiosulfate transporter family protein [uncultured Polaribacter sp.]|uniref:YeeE/YedE thiosulfate transporter family protein n=1 Tax=uncultured Polaribacter sp. TaxID=174711 RepID=UPI002632FD90|nr:YeeE/YedE thiosulfate transporter family protein [uncultured Polaribacter sp.]